MKRQLIAAHLDEELTDDMAAELAVWLRRDPENVRIFLRETSRHHAIHEILSRAESFETLPAAPRRRSWTVWAPALAAAAAVLAVAGVWIWNAELGTRKAEVGRVIARIAEANAECRTRNAEGKMVSVRAGDSVRVGMRIETGEKGSVSFAYLKEDTRVRLDENAKLDVGDAERGKRLHLIVGELAADVAKQPKDKPFVITTPHARAEIVGTSLALTAAEKSTRLDVFDGKVRFVRLSDGKSVDVSAGQSVVAAQGADLAIRPLPAGSRRAARAGEIIYPRPRTHLYGRVLFQDEFDAGLAKWDVRKGPLEIEYECITSESEKRRFAEITKNVTAEGREVIESAAVLNMNWKADPKCFVGLCSKEAIAADSFVIEARVLLKQAGGQVRVDGIEACNEEVILESPLGKTFLPVGHIELYRWEFSPGKNSKGNDALIVRYFLGDRFRRAASFTQPANRKILIGGYGLPLFIDSVVVREMREESVAEGDTL